MVVLLLFSTFEIAVDVGEEEEEVDEDDKEEEELL
jgi:hypothetical protein